MSIKSLKIVFVGLLSCAATAWAGGTSSIQGIVRDPAGQPVKGAEIRVEPRNGGNVLATTKTDASGRYTTVNLPVGTYRVTLIVNGEIKSSINNTQTVANKPVDLNFKLQPAAAWQKTVQGKKGKHMVWVPSNTGSHIGGRWVEVEEGGAAAAAASNVQTVNKADLERQIQSSAQRGQVTSGMSPFGR